MEKTFQLPNQVSSSNHVKPKPQKGPEQTQTQLTTSEYKKASTLTTSVISRSNKITPGKIENDNMCVDAATMTKQATTLRRLRWLCALLTLSTVIISATFGGFTHSLMQRMDFNERLSAKLEEALEAKTSTNAAYKSGGTADIETRLLNLESAQAQYRINTDTRLLTLETYQNQDGAEFQTISTQIDSIEANLNTNIAISQENSDRLTAIESELTKLGPNLNQSLASTIVNELQHDSNTEFVTFQDYTNETRNIWTHIETERATNEQHTTVLSQLRTDWDFVTTLVQDYTSRVTQVEADRTTDRNTVENLSTQVAQLEEDLVSDRAITTVHGEDILENGQTLIQLQTDITDLNNSIQTASDRLVLLEQDTSKDRANILLQESRIKQTETDLVAQNVSSQTHNSRIEDLESQGVIDKDTISNHTARLLQIEANLKATNATIKELNASSQAQTVRIQELEFEANETMDKFEEFDDKMTNVTDSLQASVAWLHRKVGPGLNSTTSLEDQIEELKATTVIVLNNHTSMLTVLEYRSDVAEDDIANHTSRLEEIEKNRKSDIAKLEAHFAKIIELEKADNESNAVLEMHSDALMSLELQIAFAATGNTIDSYSYIVRFDTLRSVYGTGYSTSTGVFTCYQQGLYYFSSSLVKTRSYDPRIDQIICQMYQNSNVKVNTRVDPTDGEVDYGSYETSLFLVIHLAYGDQVYVKCTTGTLEYYSSFLGFLIVAD